MENELEEVNGLLERLRRKNSPARLTEIKEEYEVIVKERKFILSLDEDRDYGLIVNVSKREIQAYGPIDEKRLQEYVKKHGAIEGIPRKDLPKEVLEVLSEYKKQGWTILPYEW